MTSREVVEAHLQRIAEVNPKINAIVRVLADEALAGADLADAAVRAGTKLGPLHGVPMTVKKTSTLLVTQRRRVFLRWPRPFRLQTRRQ